MSNARTVPAFHAAALQSAGSCRFFTPENGSYAWPIYGSEPRQYGPVGVKPSAAFDYAASEIKHRWQDKAVLDDVAKDKSCQFEVGQWAQEPAEFVTERAVTLLDRLGFRPVYVPGTVLPQDMGNRPTVMFTPARHGRSIYRMVRTSDRFVIDIATGAKRITSEQASLPTIRSMLRSNSDRMGYFFQYLGGRTSSIPAVLRAIMHTTEDVQTMGHKFPAVGSELAPARISYFEYRSCYTQLFQSLALETESTFFGAAKLNYIDMADTGIGLELRAERQIENTTPDVRVALENARAAIVQELSTDDIRLTTSEESLASVTTLRPYLRIRWSDAPVNDRVLEVFNVIKQYRERLDQAYEVHFPKPEEL